MLQKQVNGGSKRLKSEHVEQEWTCSSFYDVSNSPTMTAMLGVAESDSGRCSVVPNWPIYPQNSFNVDLLGRVLQAVSLRLSSSTQKPRFRALVLDGLPARSIRRGGACKRPSWLRASDAEVTRAGSQG
jgi:hypothetical protein